MRYCDQYKPKRGPLKHHPDLEISEKSLALAVQNKSPRGMSLSGSVGRVMENRDVFLGWKFGIVSLHKGVSIMRYNFLL